MKQIEISLKKFLQEAKSLGLTAQNYEMAQEYLENREYGLCFDIVITQLYDSEKTISLSFYCLIESLALEMKIPEKDYGYIKDMIR
ncbi:MAG: MafI family immunity protein [Sediminibacterium sp.]|nr:MafI family immunity protein [Sediminibacterium sp.]